MGKYMIKQDAINELVGYGIHKEEAHAYFSGVSTLEVKPRFEDFVSEVAKLLEGHVFTKEEKEMDPGLARLVENFSVNNRHKIEIYQEMQAHQEELISGRLKYKGGDFGPRLYGTGRDNPNMSSDRDGYGSDAIQSRNGGWPDVLYNPDGTLKSEEKIGRM